MTVVGGALVATTSQVLHTQAVREGVATAEALTRLATAEVPGDAFTVGMLEPAQDADLDALLGGLDERLVGLRLWTADGAVIYDSADVDGAPSAFPDVERLDAVRLRGEPAPRVRTHIDGLAGDAGGPLARSIEVLDVYVPVEHAGQVVGAAEVMLDHGPTAARRTQAIGTLAAVAALGLLLLWLVLFRSVHSASERLQRSAMENARLALLDALTGLPNRRMLLDRLDRAVASAGRTPGAGAGIGILLLDVDRFKDINDSLGHDRGDELLVQVATRLMEAFRGRDLVARLGGDEFAVLLPGVTSVADAETLAHRARGVFTEPFVLGGMSVHVETSIGVAVLPDHADDARSLMRRADVAMYTAKQHRLGVAVYDAADDDSSPARLVLQAELHRALARTGELTMHYQPKIDLAGGRTVGLEALMRWRHPTRGEVEPSVFIPLAEQSGLIDELTRFALRTVVAQLAAWAPEQRLPVAVNLSAHTLASEDVVDTITRLLAQHGVDPSWLEAEITETAVVADPGRVVPVLRRLSAAGVRVAIDDFGIGSTSFAQLRDLPVDVLKIDRLFIEDLGDEATAARSRTVIKAMVDLAHSFGMQVVAEGVEDAATAACLRALDVDQAQGFWFSPAVAARDVGAGSGRVVLQP
ncbi:EAL domain-containing protein [Actinotalea ferrariae]|nr:EAL domain-containing protein [Actinotalea ferrariae]